MTTTYLGPAGYARFDKVPVGTYTLTVDAPWLENDTLTATVTITPNCEIIFPPMGTVNPH
jgi:hypothetical protein